MTIESILLTIEGSFAVGVAAGLLIGVLITRSKVGCFSLLAVPMAMLLYIGWWQGEHPENLRSTSGLDFVFGSFWPSLGALAGYFAGIWIRSLSNDAQTPDPRWDRILGVAAWLISGFLLLDPLGPAVMGGCLEVPCEPSFELRLLGLVFAAFAIAAARAFVIAALVKRV